MSVLHDFVIVGNGCLGMSLAWRLARSAPEARVALVGPAGREGSASLAAAAMLNAWGEIDAGGPTTPAAAARLALQRRALAAWDEHARSLQAAVDRPLQARWGTWVVASARSTELEERAWRHLVQSLHAAGVAADVEDARALPALSPTPEARVMRALRVEDGCIDSRLVMDALDSAVAALPNCHRLDGVAVDLQLGSQGVKQVRLGDGRELRAPVVVLANGVHAQALVDRMPSLARRVPRLLFGSGMALDLAFPEHVYLPPALGRWHEVVRTLERGGGCGLHLVPGGAESRRFYLGASSSVSLLPQPLPCVHALQALLQGATDEFHETFFHAQVSLRAVGHRPVSMDTYPLLGETDCTGLWMCTGTRRDGFTCAPVIAEQMAAGLLGGRCDLPPQFRPCRPLLSYHDRTTATEIAALGAVGSDMHHGLRLPGYRRDAWALQERRRIEAIYDRRGITDFGIHPDLLHLYESDEWFAATDAQRERQ